jgi:hypothetical protein
LLPILGQHVAEFNKVVHFGSMEISSQAARYGSFFLEQGLPSGKLTVGP